MPNFTLLMPQGNIINIGSVVGEHGNVGQSAYAASKSGLVCSSQTLLIVTDWCYQELGQRIGIKEYSGKFDRAWLYNNQHDTMYYHLITGRLILQLYLRKSWSK